MRSNWRNMAPMVTAMTVTMMAAKMATMTIALMAAAMTGTTVVGMEVVMDTAIATKMAVSVLPFFHRK